MILVWSLEAYVTLVLLLAMSDKKQITCRQFYSNLEQDNVHKERGKTD